MIEFEGRQKSGYYSGVARRQFRDFRDSWIAAALERGMSIRQAARACYCSPATVAGFIKRCGRPKAAEKLSKNSFSEFREMFHGALTNDGQYPEYVDALDSFGNERPCSWNGIERNSMYYRG